MKRTILCILMILACCLTGCKKKEPTLDDLKDDAKKAAADAEKEGSKLGSELGKAAEDLKK